MKPGGGTKLSAAKTGVVEVSNILTNLFNDLW